MAVGRPKKSGPRDGPRPARRWRGDRARPKGWPQGVARGMAQGGLRADRKNQTMTGERGISAGPALPRGPARRAAGQAVPWAMVPAIPFRLKEIRDLAEGVPRACAKGGPEGTFAGAHRADTGRVATTPWGDSRRLDPSMTPRIFAPYISGPLGSPYRVDRCRTVLTPIRHSYRRSWAA